MLSPSAAAADEYGSTSFDTLTREKMAGLFSAMIRDKSANWRGSQSSSETGAVAGDRQKELMELTAHWRRQEISILIDQFRDSRVFQHGETIASRIVALRKMFQEEEGRDADISPDSLRAFITFLHQIPDARQPDITLTPGGEVYARWKGGPAGLFAVHFLTDEKVRFVVFRPNARHPRLVNRLSGVDAVDTVLETANKACSVFEWIIQ